MRVVFRSPILTLVTVPVVDRAGAHHDFVRLQMADWVAVAAITPDGQHVLVEQHRVGADRVGLEVAGGLMEPGETPEDAARRELAEETGHAGGALEPLGVVWPNPALQDNRCHLFVARGVVEAGPQRLDPTEDVRVVKLAPAQVREALADGRVHAALSVLTLLRAARPE